jgi:S1-C subfamily serine protease
VSDPDVRPVPDVAPSSVRRRHLPRWLAAGAIVAAIAATGLGTGFAAGPSTTKSTTTSSTAVGVSTREVDVSAITDAVDPAVVDITATLGFENGKAAGTGMVLTSSGEVLTNNHVIEGATSIKVDLNAGNDTRTVDAEVIGVDPTDDIALLQLQHVSGLPTVTIGDSSTIAVGDKIVAIGNALDLPGPPRVTQGSIDAVRRTITVDDGRGGAERLTDVIQIDAELSPGNSGGPLVDAEARVIGLNSAAELTNSEDSSSTTGFAIPINRAMTIVHQIESGREDDKVQVGPTAFLGVQIQDVGPNRSGDPFDDRGNLPVDSGALVRGVDSDAPAANAGIESGDIITAVSGKTVSSASALTQMVRVHDPGDTITIDWIDSSGSHRHANVKLATGPAA